MPVSVGPGIRVNVASVVLVPAAVVTVTRQLPGVAVDAIVNVVVSEVPAAFTVRAPVWVTPLQEMGTALAPVKLVPVMVTATFLVPAPGIIADVGSIP